MKKTILTFAIALVATTGAFARPHGGGHGGGPRGGFGGPAMHHGGGRHHGGGHHHGGGFWGHGGRNFWPGFVGGIVGGALFDATYRPAPVVVSPAPVVVAPPPPPVVTPVYHQVWVEGRYVDQVQPNGAVIRVWQPGHYEQRLY